MMVVAGLAVTMIEDTGQIGKTVVQLPMVPGVITARAAASIEQELSTTEAVQEAPVITTLQPKTSLSRLVVLITVMPGVITIARTMISIAKEPVMTRAALVEAATTIPGQTSL